jgi:hypothetical protein
MCRKLILLTSFVVVLGLVNSATAEVLVHFSFDGVIDTNLPSSITDDTASVTFDVFLDPCESGSKAEYGAPNPWFNIGGTSARFIPNAGLVRHATGADILDLAGYQYTIEMFLMINSFAESDTALIKKYRDDYYLGIERTNDQAGKLQYNQAGDRDDGHRVESDANAIKLGTWYHIAAVFDACDSNKPQKLYIDGVKVDSNGTSLRNPGTDVNVAIAHMIRPKDKDFGKDDWVDGWIDELRISDEALDPNDFLLSPGQMGKQASQPWPGYGDTDVCPNNVQLSWKPGEDVNDANGHDVYFDTDYGDVRDANRTIHPGLLYYSEGQDSNKYPEDSNLPQLELMTTYYWRVDQVNEPNIYRGSVWEFTTEDGNARDPTPGDGLRGYNPTNVVLRWTPSCVASSQTVYFSTNLNDVNTMDAGAIEDTVGGDINNCPIGTLEKFTYYYWRIKTTRSGALGTGATKVWKFKTGFGGLLLYLPFDGTEDANLPNPVTDSSGNDLVFTTFAAIYDSNATGSVKYGEPRFALGGTLASADFEPNAGLYRPDPCGPNEPNVPDLLRLDGYQYTIEFWVKPGRLDSDMEIDDDDPRADWLDEDFDLVLIGKFDSWVIGIQDPAENNTFRWQHNGETEDMYDDSAVVGEWAHVAAVYDQSLPDDEMKFYLNGELVGTDSENDLNPPDNNYPVTIGYAYQSDVNVGRYFDGCIDELRIWDIAYEPELEIATKPHPTHKYRPLEPNDANYAKFMWKPGKYAQSTAGHKLYFGDSLDDVNESADPCAILDSNSWTHGITFELTKTYYWRVDEVNGTDVWPGNIWRFETRSLIVHPNMLVWYKLDQTEGEGRDVYDSSGRYFDAECDNTPHWEPNNGRFDGCMNFLIEHSDWDEDDQEWNWDEEPGSIEMDDDKTKKMAALINKEISISVWINGDPNQRRDDDMVVFELCDDDYDDDIDGDANKTKVLAVVPTEPTDTGYVAFRAGLYPQDYLVYTEGNPKAWRGGNPKAWRGSWQHWVFIKDENEGKMYIYLNNELVAFKEDCNTTSLVNVKGTGDPDLKLGSYVDNDDGYDGRMDDFQIYNIHLTESEIEEIFRCGALGVSCPGLALAWSPSPYDGQGDVYHKADLSWEPGAYVASTNGHEVFFGTNYDEIAAANTVTHPNVVHDTCSTTFFDPGPLELGQTYYWRIDEVNDPCTWTGRTWSFTVADFFIIEDFESYNPSITDGWEAVEKCMLNLATEDEEWWIQPRGWKSLEYKGWSSQDPYYSEARSKFVLDPNDWTILDNKMKLLTLWFYGLSHHDEIPGDINPCTATERWWVELEDIDNDKGRVWYPTADATDFRQDEWLYWDIPLSDFNDANPSLDLNKLLKLHLGFGTGVEGVGQFTVVYWDDIRLAPAYCNPSERKPQADISGPYKECDCQVDYYDLDLMAGQWLDSDCNCVEEYGSMPAPPEANLVAWYKFNDGSGSTATDSTSNNYDGTIEVIDVNVFWVTGHNDAGYALEFDGGWVSVPNETTLKLNLPNSVTVCAWVDLAEPIDDDTQIVCKGRNDKETYALELNKDGKFRFKVRKSNGDDVDIDSGDKLPTDEWVHIAGTCDGNNMTLYLNGQVEKSEQKGDLTPFLVDANDGLGIAERPGDLGTNSWYPFIGTIDDVRIYDCNLSGAEICYIASDGDGVAEIVKIANIFTDEPEGTPQAVNLKDFAVLMIEWLAEEQPLLWPE